MRLRGVERRRIASGLAWSEMLDEDATPVKAEGESATSNALPSTGGVVDSTCTIWRLEIGSHIHAG